MQKKLHCSLHCTRTLVQYSVVYYDVYYAVHITVVRHITSMCGAPAPNIPNIPPSHSMLFARNHQNHRHRHSCHHHCDIVIIVVIIVFIKATHSLDINWQEKLPNFIVFVFASVFVIIVRIERTGQSVHRV